MILTRQDIEARESRELAPYAVKSAESRGRLFPEDQDPYRTCFQRDRDRVIHSKAFRRLKGKTQVFVAHYGDHYRSRLAHSMEVAQLSRDMARTLNLNEDLAETIGLAHDLGHTPFGHAGQDEMNLIMQEFGERFEHNEQSKRVVEVLEEKSPHYRGLNLSFEVRDGLIKHRTTYDTPLITDTKMPSIEAQIVNLADEIAYMNHDIDDGLRAGILHPDTLGTLALWQAADGIPERIISLMVNDLVKHTDGLLTTNKIASVAQVHQTETPLAAFTPEMEKMTTALKAFLHKNFYTCPSVSEYNKKGKVVVRELFNKLMADPTLLPDRHQAMLTAEKPALVVRDYIAGMTDDFALSLYEEIA